MVGSLHGGDRVDAASRGATPAAAQAPCRRPAFRLTACRIASCRPSLRATLIGFAAVLMWSLLSLLTVASGRMPPFQLAAITFAIGGGIGAATWSFRPRRSGGAPQPPEVWALGVAGLFGYHALYFMALRLAPPAEAQLVNYLWPLLIVLFSALLPASDCGASCRGRAARSPRHRVLFLGRGGIGFATEYLPALRRRSSPRSSGRPIRCCRAALPTCRPTRSPASALRRRALSAICHLLFEETAWPAARPNGSRSWRSASGRWARRSTPGISGEARRHPCAGRGVLCGADSVDLSWCSPATRREASRSRSRRRSSPPAGFWRRRIFIRKPASNPPEPARTHLLSGPRSPGCQPTRCGFFDHRSLESSGRRSSRVGRHPAFRKLSAQQAGTSQFRRHLPPSAGPKVRLYLHRDHLLSAPQSPGYQPLRCGFLFHRSLESGDWRSFQVGWHPTFQKLSAQQGSIIQG